MVSGMTDIDDPWEPPLAGTDIEHLVGALERLRTTFRWKADALDAAGLSTRVGASTLTLGGLLKHLAAVENRTFSARLTAEQGEPWDTGGDDWKVTSAAGDASEVLYDQYDFAVDRSRARLTDAIADGGLDREIHSWRPGRGQDSLRQLVYGLLEEYGRHTGHADLIREAVDGRVGEDPPHGWQPVSGHFRLPR